MKKKYLKLKVLIGSGKTTPCTILKEHMQKPNRNINKTVELIGKCNNYRNQMATIEQKKQLLELRQRATNLGVVDTTDYCQLCQQEKNKPYNKNNPIGKHNLDKALMYCNNCRLKKIKEAEFYFRVHKHKPNFATKSKLKNKLEAAEKANADYRKLKAKIES